MAKLDRVRLSFEVFDSFEEDLSAHLEAVDEVFSLLGEGLALGAQVAHLLSLGLDNLQHLLLRHLNFTLVRDFHLELLSRIVFVCFQSEV